MEQNGRSFNKKHAATGGCAASKMNTGKGANGDAGSGATAIDDYSFGK